MSLNKDMIITKRKNKFIKYLVLLLFTSSYSCVGQIIDKKIDNCLVITSDTNFEFNFQSDILNNEFQDLYNSIFDYDIILLKNQSGNCNYTYERWSVKGNSCHYLEIINGEKSKSIQFKIDQSSIYNLFINFESRSIFERCTKCYDCERYVGLIKKGSSISIFQLSEKIQLTQDIRLKTSKDIILFLENHRF